MEESVWGKQEKTKNKITVSRIKKKEEKMMTKNTNKIQEGVEGEEEAASLK